MEMVMMSMREMKFDEITVTSQPINPSRPIIVTPATTQLASGSIFMRTNSIMLEW